MESQPLPFLTLHTLTLDTKPFQLTFASMTITYRRFHNFTRIEISEISSPRIEDNYRISNSRNILEMYTKYFLVREFYNSKVLNNAQILRLHFRPPKKIFSFFLRNQNSFKLVRNYIITRDLSILSTITTSIHPLSINPSFKP